MVALEYSPKAMELVISILLSSSNTIRYEPSFKWQLVEKDPDDNKFVDCALGANVDYLITEDKHIRQLAKIKNLFPPLPVISFNEFLKILEDR